MVGIHNKMPNKIEDSDDKENRNNTLNNTIDVG